MFLIWFFAPAKRGPVALALGFVIADRARGYGASMERDDAVLLRNAVEEASGFAR
ncbi:hypothetical protein [Burkholderia sp. BCC0405]|uniref:hypothetical protein n=1 Tax=Burkholderia sp. BCC0405 TaxID=2676298 RepID=UPI00158EC499|nr:hypothetical protein [Burkholderia sp. BCC0405]